METPAARERQAHAQTAPGRKASDTGGASVQEGYRSRDITAESASLSRGTYQNIKTAITAASSEDEPKEVRAGHTTFIADEPRPLRREAGARRQARLLRSAIQPREALALRSPRAGVR